MSKFIPTLYIDTGETNALFTLKKKYLHISYIGAKKHFEVRGKHLCVLSADPDAAYSKALVIAEKFGLALETSRDNMGKLREITKKTYSHKEPGKTHSNSKKASPKELISNGIYPFGKYAGKQFHLAPREYIVWLIDNAEKMEPGLLKDLAIAVTKTCSHFKLPVAKKDQYFGVIGDSIKEEVIVVGYTEIGPKSEQSPYPFSIISLVTKDHSMLIIKTGKFKPKIGARLTITAIIKKHANFKGQAQTELESVKIV